MSRLMGQRFAPSKREQSVLLGTLTTGTDKRVVNLTRKQTDNGEQVEINIVGSPGLLSWEAGTGSLSSGVRAAGSDRELIERLVLDSPDQFVLAQLRGASYHTRDIQPRMLMSSPHQHSPVGPILGKLLLESNQKLLNVLLGGYFSAQVSIRFCIVIFPATVFTFSQSRQRVNA